MTNPTSNFGWQMPTPTDLVTDLPADFEVFGQAVDTSMADLKGGTTGQILSKATNADMDFTWITNDVGDITAVNVSAPITGGGTSGAVTIGVSAASTSASGVVQLSDSTSTTSSVLASTPTATKSAYDLAAAAVPKSTVTTAGDVIYATGSGAVTRLGIGTAGQVLKVNSGATAPEWGAAGGASGLVFISGTSFSAVSSVSLPNSTFTTTYTNYLIQFTVTSCSASNDLGVRGRTSGTDLSTSVYDYAVNGGKTNSTTYTFGSTSGDRMYIASMTTGSPYRGSITLFSPQTTANTYSSTSGLGTESNLFATANAAGIARSAAQFDAATIFPSTGTITGFYNVYGFANS